MDHETKYVLCPILILVVPEMVSTMLGVSDVAMGGYYNNQIDDQKCGSLAPIPGILIAVGIAKIISCMLFIDQSVKSYPYKTGLDFEINSKSAGCKVSSSIKAMSFINDIGF
jgi:hypothetical protein